MPTTVILKSDQVNTLDLSPAHIILDQWLATGSSQELALSFQIEYDRDPEDPRELSEIPEVRLWFIRLDSHYPWLPYSLAWDASELVRYTAMLVPHQFSSAEGIQFNPEALEIFVMQKVFVITQWMQQKGMVSRSKIKFMTKLLGYDLDDAFFELIGC